MSDIVNYMKYDKEFPKRLGKVFMTDIPDLLEFQYGSYNESFDRLFDGRTLTNTTKCKFLSFTIDDKANCTRLTFLDKKLGEPVESFEIHKIKSFKDLDKTSIIEVFKDNDDLYLKILSIFAKSYIDKIIEVHPECGLKTIHSRMIDYASRIKYKDSVDKAHHTNIFSFKDVLIPYSEVFKLFEDEDGIYKNIVFILTQMMRISYESVSLICNQSKSDDSTYFLSIWFGVRHYLRDKE